MNGWEQFCLGFKDFMNQPIPIICCSVGALIFFVAVILANTSIGKKALNKIKDINEKLNIKVNNLLKQLDNSIVEFKEFKKNKEEEIKKLTEKYELILSSYKEELSKQNEMIKVLSENSVNKNVKAAYEHYSKDLLVNHDVGSILNNINEHANNEYEERLKKLEEMLYGKETKDN